MAIQMRRGLRKDFDQSKMLPGEWAVSIDTDTNNQIVWMCFAAGICKRMGTYEDFTNQITEATADIRDAYVVEFGAIKATVQALADAVSSDKNEILIIKSDIVNTYLPQIQALTERAETATSKAETYANNSANSATLSKSYAIGGTGTREGENADNSKYYYEQAKHISQGGNGLVPMGTIAFEDIPTSNITNNAMYNINNDFTSDDRFVDGGGVLYGKGSNIFYTVDGLWDVLAASDVKGVKGSAEDTYRQGNVTITPANIGLENVDNTADADKPISKAVQIAFDEVNETIGTIEEKLATAEGAIQKNADDIETVNSNLLTHIPTNMYIVYGMPEGNNGTVIKIPIPPIGNIFLYDLKSTERTGNKISNVQFMIDNTNNIIVTEIPENISITLNEGNIIFTFRNSSYWVVCGYVCATY